MATCDAPLFDLDLIKKYDQPGPRYTSYPTAVVFDSAFAEEQYRQHALDSNRAHAGEPLSLYFHIPFCDTLCFYCACNKIATKKREKADLYLDYLDREMALHAALYEADRQVRQMHFGGGTPTFLTPPQFDRMMQLIRRHFPLVSDEQRDYSIEIDPRSVSGDDILTLRDHGFNRFSLGVQDVNPAVQKAVNRIQPAEMTQGIIDACRQAGAKSVSVDLVYGLPLQTLDSFSQTVDAVIGMDPDRLSVFNYAHLPHLFSPQKRIRAEDLPGPAEKLAILQMSIEKLTQAGYVYIGMDHFAKPDDELAQAQRNGTLQRNFQGYTTHAELDLVAMGVSSISSVNSSFSQNVKSLDQYYALLDRHKIPVFRGYALNADDRLRKDIIQQLACHFSLDFEAMAHRHGVDFEGYFASELERLRDMESDGLLRLSDSGLQVEPAGRLLIRHVCMVFDAYLNQTPQQASGTPRFSKVI